MTRLFQLLALSLALGGLAGCAPQAAVAESAPTGAPAPATATVGAPAPDFTLPDLDGAEVTLSALRGKTVVLEWFNPDCPFVKYAHGPKGPLRGLADAHAAQGVVWIAVNSGAPGKQGAGLERNRAAIAEYGMKHAVLRDESGAVGRLYGAKTTPQMFVINGEGLVVYAGALDNAPLGNPTGAYENHVDAALADLAAGRPIGTPSTKSYGCSVKYGS